jgi:hypothetical protein
VDRLPLHGAPESRLEKVGSEAKPSISTIFDRPLLPLASRPRACLDLTVTGGCPWVTGPLTATATDAVRAPGTVAYEVGRT